MKHIEVVQIVGENPARDRWAWRFILWASQEGQTWGPT